MKHFQIFKMLDKKINYVFYETLIKHFTLLLNLKKIIESIYFLRYCLHL